MKLDLAHILRVALPLLLLLGGWAARRWNWSRKLELGLLLVLALGALFAHAEWLHFDQRRGSIQNREFFHYFIGSKYFPEVGYYDLYNATALADLEDDPKGFVPRLLVRELRDQRKILFRATVVKRYAHVKQKFSKARWAAFKKDIAWFRNTYKDGWRHTVLFHDHGYNGSPVLHVLLGTIASKIPLSLGTALRVLSYADLILVILSALLLCWLLDPRVALLFVCFFGFNPFNEAAFIAGAYLRYLDLLAMVFCLVCWRRGYVAWAGALCCLAISIRVFEVVWMVPLLVLLGLRWRDTDVRQQAMRFAGGMGLATVLVIGSTSLLVPATKVNPWVDFAKRLSVHGAVHPLNTISLKNAFHYSDSVNRRNFGTEPQRIFQERWWLYAALCALFCLLLLLYCRLCSPMEALFGGICLVFLFQPLSHYYYYVLALIPLLFREREPVVLLALLCLLVAIVRMVWGTSFVSFHLQGCLLLVYFLATLTLRLKQLDPTRGEEDAPAEGAEVEAT